MQYNASFSSLALRYSSNWQRAGHGTSEHAAEKLDPTHAAGDCGQNHPQQRDDLCHGKQHRQPGALCNHREVQRGREAARVADRHGDPLAGEHLPEHGTEAAQEGKATTKWVKVHQ